jgi:hypothetical protein
MKFIKDEKLITWEYVKKLHDFILKNQETFFLKENEADHWRDFEFWPDKKTDRNHLIMPSEICLIDREINGVHCYVICKILGKINTSKPRVIHIDRVINIEELDRNYWKNGYFLLPDLSFNEY